jgi:hypothetical protein
MEEFTPEEVERMGAKSLATHQPTAAPGDVMEEFTPEQVAAMGAKAPEAPQNLGGTNPGAFLRGVGQGATFGFGDEIGGAIQAGLSIPGELMRGIREDKTLGDSLRGVGGVYREAVRDERQLIEDDIKNRMAASLAGNVSGGLLLAAGTAGFGSAGGGAGIARSLANPTTLRAALGAGALTGLGQANIDDPNKTMGEKALTGALNVAGGGLGYGAAKVAGMGADKVSKWAGNKVGEITKRTDDWAATLARKESAKMAGGSGGETTEAMNLASKLDTLKPIPPEAVSSWGPSQLDDFALSAAEAASQRADELTQKASASGMTAEVLKDMMASPTDLRSKSKVMADAAAAYNQAEFYRSAANSLREQAEKGIDPTALANQYNQLLEKMQQDPALLLLKHNMLLNKDKAMGGLSAKIMASQQAAKQAFEGEAERAAQYSANAQNLGLAMKNTVIPWAKRYWTIPAGAAAGYAFGDSEGALLGGGVMGGSAIATYARPAFRSLANKVGLPAVQKAMYRTVQKAVNAPDSLPDALKPYASLLAQYAGRSADEFMMAMDIIDKSHPELAKAIADSASDPIVQQQAAAQNFLDTEAKSRTQK